MEKVYKHFFVIRYSKNKECFGYIREDDDGTELLKEEIDSAELETIISELKNIQFRKITYNGDFIIQFQNFRHYIHYLSFSNEETRNRIFERLIENAWFQL